MFTNCAVAVQAIAAAYVQDDSRKYPGKEAAGFLPGATGGFMGGEMGVRSFVDSGKLSVADPAEVRRRNTTKDVSLLIGLAVLAVVTGVAAQQLGLVDFVGDVAQSGGDAAGDVAEAAAKSAPLQVSAPRWELTRTQQGALAVGGASFGTWLLIKAARDGVAATVQAVGSATKRTVLRSVVLAGAGTVGYFLLRTR